MRRAIRAAWICAVLVACSARHPPEDDAFVPVDAARIEDGGPDGAIVDAARDDASRTDGDVGSDAGATDAAVPEDTYTREDDAFVPVDADLGPGSPCDATTDCGATLYCDFENAYDCGTTSGGTCTQRPPSSSCTGPYREVCGCDGMRYFNACDANAGGTDVRSVGPCS